MNGTFTEADTGHMRRALELAERGRGAVHPNPMVGAVLVKDGSVVGEGWHAQAGGDHAEVAAIRAAGKEARGAHLYVTLEPCNHYGKTPPCTDAILGSGVAGVVIARVDPNPGVKGGGERALRARGLEVRTGLLEEEARELNREWEKLVSTGTPFVYLKVAMTADGKIATRAGLSRWITGPEARGLVHELRRGCDAVLTGIGTVLADDPELTVRNVPLGGARPPLRVVLDSRLRIPAGARLLDGEPPALVLTTRGCDRARADELRRRGVEVIELGERDGRIDLQEALGEMGSRGVASLLVEAGPAVCGSFIGSSLVDRLLLFVAPKVFGGEEAPGWLGDQGVDRPDQAVRLTWLKAGMVGEDILLEATMERG
jgi:diaminohydroxyphosphoribosylaminopyrimidine deaminase / 5-amino-6-(5-phosphoribosylamino)uracil reductase